MDTLKNVSASIKETKTINLVLAEKEARWLREAMQNPLHGESLVDEDEEVKRMRHELFEALRGLGDF